MTEECNQLKSLERYLNMLTKDGIANAGLVHEALYTASENWYFDAERISFEDAIKIWRIVTAFGHVEVGSETDILMRKTIRM